MKKRNIHILVLFAILIGCEKDVVIKPKSYPFVITKKVTNIDSTGVTFNAELLDFGKEEIIDFGFMLDNKDNMVSLLESGGTLNNFTLRISADLKDDQNYLCRAYVQTNDRQVFGNAVAFISKGCLAPQIIEVLPASGKPSKLISIIGRYFSQNADNNAVQIGLNMVEVLDVRKDTLIVQVPDTKETKIVDIKVTVANKTTQSNIEFSIISPWTVLDNFPGDSKWGSSYFSIGSKGYVTVGNSSNYDQLASAALWEFNMENKEWRVLSQFPGARRKRAISFSIGGVGYVGLGESSVGNYFNDLWKYSPWDDTWEKLADYPGINATLFPYSYFIINNKLYLTSQDDTKIWTFDPLLNQWSEILKDDNIISKEILAGFSINNKGYFIESFGGYGELKGFRIWEYNEYGNKIQIIGSVNTQNFLDFLHTKCFTIGNKLFLSLDNEQIVEYNLENGNTFYYSQYSQIGYFNFIFDFGNKVIFNNCYTSELYEFFPSE